MPTVRTPPPLCCRYRAPRAVNANTDRLRSVAFLLVENRKRFSIGFAYLNIKKYPHTFLSVEVFRTSYLILVHARSDAAPN